MKEISVEAEGIQEALEQAAAQLGVSAEDLEYEVVSDAEKKAFGRVKNAEIRAWIPEDEDDDADEAQDEEDAEEGNDDADEGAGSEEQEEQAEEQAAPVSHYPTRENLTEEELDEVADTAIDILRDILVFFDADEATIEEYEGDDGEIILDVVGEDLAVLIGRHGRTLDALQALVKTATNRALGYRYPVIIDVEGYRSRQRQKIEGLARSAASRAVRQGGSVKLRPMTPYERRIVHITLRDDERVTTASEGKEPSRQVVVTPV